MRQKEVESTKQHQAENVKSVEIFYPNDAKKTKGDNDANRKGSKGENAAVKKGQKIQQ